MIYYKYEHMFDYIFFFCKCWLIYVSRQISTGRIQELLFAGFGNIRDFKDEMHLKILKKLCMHKITINQCEFVIFASQGFFAVRYHKSVSLLDVNFSLKIYFSDDYKTYVPIICDVYKV